MAAYHIGAEISNNHLYRGGAAGLNALHFNVNQAILAVSGAVDCPLRCIIGLQFFESIISKIKQNGSVLYLQPVLHLQTTNRQRVTN